MPENLKPRTLKVRIAVAVDPTGEWVAAGWGLLEKVVPDDELMSTAVDTLNPGEARYILTAELAIPTSPVVVDANVEDKTDG